MMTRDEVKKILAKITILYPRFNVGEAVCGLRPTDVWHEMIGDMDYEKAIKALAVCAQVCKYPPTIADIREEYNKIIADEKKIIGQIKEYYNKCRSFYPGGVEYGEGWGEFSAAVGKDITKAERLYTNMVKYINSIENVPEFSEAIRKVSKNE